MGIDATNDAQIMVAAAGAGAAKAQEGLAGPKPEHGEHGGSASGSSPSACDEPAGDHGGNSVNPSPRLPHSAMDEEDERDAEEQAAIASIILQLSQQPPVAKRRRVRVPPGGAHSDHHEAAAGKHGAGGGADTEARRSRGGGGQASGSKGSRPVSQPPTPQPPPSTPSGGLPGLPSFAHFPDPVRRQSLTGNGGGIQYQMPPLPQLSLSDCSQSNTLPAILPNKEAFHTHLPPPSDGIFQNQQSLGAAHPSSLHPLPGALSGASTCNKGRPSGGLANGGSDGNDQNSSGQHHGGNGPPETGASERGDGAEQSTPTGAAGPCSKATEVRRPYRCSKCGAEKKGHLCSAKLAANMMPATPIKRVDLAARLAARLQSGGGDGSEGMEAETRGLRTNDLSNLPFFRSFRAEEVYGEAVLNHPALAAGVPVLMKCPPGAWAERLAVVSQMGS